MIANELLFTPLSPFTEKFLSMKSDIVFCGFSVIAYLLIAAGDIQWQKVMADFWNPFKDICDSAKAISSREVIDTLDTSLGSHFFSHQVWHLPLPFHLFFMGKFKALPLTWRALSQENTEKKVLCLGNQHMTMSLNIGHTLFL